MKIAFIFIPPVLLLIGFVSGDSDSCLIWLGVEICNWTTPTTTTAVTTTKFCPINQYCDSFGICQNFNSFSELNPRCSDLQFDESTFFNECTLFPDQRLVLDSSFDFVGFNNLYAFNTSSTVQFIVMMSFYNIKGFDTSLIRLKLSADLFHFTTYIFFKPSLSFYNNGQPIEGCKSGLYNKNGSNVLSSFDSLVFVNPIYQRPLCPFMFENLQLHDLTVHSAEFLDFDWSQIKSELGVYIKTLWIFDGKKLDLSSDGLISNIFKRVERLKIYESSVKSFSSKEQFASLQNIKSIELLLLNFRGFFHSCGLEWVQGLNLDKRQDFLDNLLENIRNHSDLIMTVYEINENFFPVYFNIKYQNNKDYVDNPAMFPYLTYQFPDEDFCLFAHWPHQRLVFPLINGSIKTNCSSACTVIWLHKNLQPILNWANSLTLLEDIFINFINMFTNECIKTWLKSSLTTSFDNVFEGCNFEKRLNLCSVISSEVYHDPYFDFFDFKVAFDQLKLVLLSYFLPVICLFSIITNFLIMFVILKNKSAVKTIQKKANGKKPMVLLKEQLYQYMLMNACINLILCLVRLLDSLIICVPGKFLMISNFLVKVLTFEVIALTNQCHVKTVVIEWVVSYLKLMSNFFYVQMCISRMLLVGKDHGSFYLKLSAVKKKTYFITTSIISIALGTIVYFQQSAIDWRENKSHTYLTDYYYDQNYAWFYNLKSRLTQARSYDNLNSSKATIPRIPLILALTLIYDAISYLFFCITGIVIDVSTLLKLKESLIKKETVKNNKEVIQGEKTTLSEESREVERKMVVMIILNSLCNIVLRSPELFSFIFFVYSAIFPFSFRMFCLNFRECLAIDQLVDCGYLLSIGLNFFFYFFFNKNFNEAAKLVISCSRKKPKNVA